jgi:hypothetical protein
VRRCTVSDGNEVCCLEEGTHDVHMGRWYTMTEQAIERERVNDWWNRWAFAWFEMFNKPILNAWGQVVDWKPRALPAAPPSECENGGIVGCFCSVCNPVGWEP